MPYRLVEAFRLGLSLGTIIPDFDRNGLLWRVILGRYFVVKKPLRGLSYQIENHSSTLIADEGGVKSAGHLVALS